MSNESDRNYITTNKGQSDAARSLFNAFSEYKSKVEGKASAVMLRDRTSLPDIKAQLTPEQKKEVEAVAKAEKDAAAKPAATASTKPAAQSSAASSAKPAAQPAATTPAKPAATTTSNIRFYVQIASLTAPKDKNSADFRSYRGKVVEKRTPSGAYKYMVGGYATYDEGMRQQSVVRKEFPDAFLVAYEGDNQLKLDDARRRAK